MHACRSTLEDPTLADVTVFGGSLNRDHTVVSFPYAPGKGELFALRDTHGSELPVQVDANGVAMFVLPALAAGARASFTLVRATRTSGPRATVQRVAGALRLAVGGVTVTEFKTESALPAGIDPVYARAGYLHPVYTPGGIPLTGDYPEDHRHHHGIWTAWTRTRFHGHAVDFWNVDDKQGRVDLAGVESTWAGPVHAGFTATLEHVDVVDGATTALHERWLVRAYATHTSHAPYFVFDLESTQAAATTMPVELEQYHYGGFALRGHEAWKTVANAVVVASEGLDRATGDNAPGRWCFLGGKVDGRSAGYAALGHPTNFRAPQKMRIHPEDPYMAFAPVRDGAFTIQPGTPYGTRLRFVTVDGPPDAALFDRLWNDYARPPEVTWTPR